MIDKKVKFRIEYPCKEIEGIVLDKFLGVGSCMIGLDKYKDVLIDHYLIENEAGQLFHVPCKNILSIIR